MRALYEEELFHSKDYLYAKNNTPKDVSSHEYEEWRAQVHQYKNQGLYSKSGLNWIQRINNWGRGAGLYGTFIKSTSSYITQFNVGFSDFIYSIPRKW